MSEQLRVPPPPAEMAMRREPRQQRTRDVVLQIEVATLQLLEEQGFTALNTNAIADRAGVGIKSLYRLFPNKESIIYRLASQRLNAILDGQQAFLPFCHDVRSLLEEMDNLLRQVDDRFSGYGPLGNVMGQIPALKRLEIEYEKIQVTFWVARLKELGCQWPQAELTSLATYVYRITDIARQCRTEQGSTGQFILQLHHNWTVKLLTHVIKEPDPQGLLDAFPPI